MKIGICLNNTDRIRLAHSIGYDFVEVSNTSVSSLNDEDFEKLLVLKNECRDGFFYAANGLVPADIRLTGNNVEFERIQRFAEYSFERLSFLGIKILVFGSSKAKHVPEGFSFEKATEQLVRVTSIFGSVAAKYGMNVCIEPLNTAECNIINTAEDAVNLADMTKLSNVFGHVDYYHMMQNGESMRSLTSLAPRIIHAHIASPVKRAVVCQYDGADYSAFFKCLRFGGYDKTVSFEGHGASGEKNLSDMLKYLKSL